MAQFDKGRENNQVRGNQVKGEQGVDKKQGREQGIGSQGREQGVGSQGRHDPKTFSQNEKGRQGVGQEHNVDQNRSNQPRR